ncbi:hypothetical protein RUM43_004818 [Polyplax serrata]|uniref:Transporter n=1 Tax=Polyplax serrata TaxID=468196 RepID=A0AAN8XLQ9_POLSC
MFQTPHYEELGKINLGYQPDESQTRVPDPNSTSCVNVAEKTQNSNSDSSVQNTKGRQQWGSSMEFLMSCIAMSVGLGNIWRFPFTAYENGGGAFLIPYIITLVIVGRPLYYMEMIVGQFTSRGCVKIWECVPILMGVGYGQIIGNVATLTYYCAIMAITLFYLIASFSSELPWTRCKPEWQDCFDSVVSNGTIFRNTTGLRSSSELYFLNEVLHEKDQIDDGIGLPDKNLTLCLALTWFLIMLVVIKGVKSSGKVAYFLALFPYVVLVALLIRGCTLPGALDGIIFFIKPQWSELLNPKVTSFATCDVLEAGLSWATRGRGTCTRVWYAAVTQAFFSLTVCFGALITYSSYNDFRHNIYRDAMIVTSLDTGTSLMAGVTIFGILGNLAHESGTTDIASVTKGGSGLAFISYPDAIAKFQVVPQFFSVLFFFMLFVLGVGSSVSVYGAIITIFTDQFPGLKYWKAALVTTVLGFVLGLIYVTPGGQYMLNLVDYFAVSFNIFILASIEVIGISWIYGLENLCNDVEFMLKIKVGIYWRICWGIFTPITMIVILVYSLVIASPLTYGDYVYPDVAYGGYSLIRTLKTENEVQFVSRVTRHYFSPG